MHNSPHNPGAFHLSELLDQHFLRNARDCALKIGKSEQLATEEMEENYKLPPAFQELKRLLDAGCSSGRCVFHLTFG